MSGYSNPELRALDEVEDILEAFAGARLAPTGPVLSRMRAAVLAEANVFARARAAEVRRVEAALARPTARRRFRLPAISMQTLARPAFALGFAGLLALATGTAVTSAAPGSPFYGARVALEAALLPTQIDARLASIEQHLDERLAAAELAAEGGDAAALAAALASYQEEIDSLLADVGDDYGRLSHFEAVLEKHIAKLVALSVRLPTEVARDNAGAHAIQASEKAVTKVKDAVDKVKEKKVHAKNRPPSPPGQNNGGGNGGNGTGGGNGGTGGGNGGNQGPNPDR